MPTKTAIFLTGATGYLGGATLQLLMQNADLSITVLVRDKEKAAKLENLGLKTVIGSLDDAALMETEAVKADAIMQSASFEHVDGVSALLRGAKNRFIQTGKRPIFIQTSGAAAFVKLDAMGEYSSERVISDADSDLFDFKNTTPHNIVNDIVIAADGEGYVRTYIVYPANIYGVLKGPLVDAGVSHAFSMLSVITLAIEFSIQRGQGAMVGKGLNRWPAAHIDDAAGLYKLILERALADEAPHGAQGTFVIENCEYTFVDAAKCYTAVLHAHGKSAGADPDTCTADELARIPRLFFLGTDVRLRGDRARKLGWRPVHGVETFYTSVKEDTEAVLAGKDD
ncbi:NAD(P)-binding protein [Peniophora sp. CONT]|nr:NAD(P)-binding protein [Peniophora sp. CONT]